MWRTWGILLVAACFSPSAPAGAPCQPDDNDCPSSQTCELVGGGYYCSTGAEAQTLDAPTTSDAFENSALDGGSLDAPSVMGSAHVAFVQANMTKPTAMTTALTLSHPVTAGDAIIICLNYPAAPGVVVSSITDTGNNAYQLVVGPVAGAGDTHYIAIAEDTAFGTDTITVTLSEAPTGGADLFALEYSGIVTSNAFDVSAVATGSDTAMDSGSAMTRSAPELILGYAEAPSASAGSGFTRRALQTGNLVEDMVAPMKGSYSATATTTAGSWTMLMATFKAH